MRTTSCRFAAASALAGFIFASVAGAADAPSSSSRSGSSAAAKSGSARGAARGPVPDPALLDGSTHPVAKKSEHGMIGDFELPGDENANPSKVGGNGPGSGGGTQPNQGQKSPQISVPGLPGVPNPLGVPGGQGGLPGLPAPGGLGIDPAQQGGGLPQIPNPLGGAGAGQQGGPPPGQQGGQQGGGAQGGGQPGGVQVGGLQGESAAGNNPAGAPDGKPSAVSIGDSAMRIEPTPGMAGSTSATQQNSGNTQHHEKGTGTGGRQPTGVQSGNRVEKGRAIPAGL